MLLLLAISLFANVELLQGSQYFSVKARCNHFPFFEVCSIGPCPHVIVFHFGERFQTCPFLVTVFMGHVGTGGTNGKKLTFSKENGYMWTERCSKRKKRLLFSSVNVQSILC